MGVCAVEIEQKPEIWGVGEAAGPGIVSVWQVPPGSFIRQMETLLGAEIWERHGAGEGASCAQAPPPPCVLRESGQSCFMLLKEKRQN